MKTLKNYFLIALLSAAVMAGCRDDDDGQACPAPCDDPSNPECPNYDPCFGENPTRADFVIEQLWWFAPDSLRYVGGTSGLTRGTIRFRALEEEATSYRWYLGAEEITEPVFERTFGTQVPLGSMITASLVITNDSVNSECFPNDIGRDSIAKNFFILSRCDMLVNNRFRGTYLHAPGDTTEFELYFDDPSNPECSGVSFSAFNLGNSGLWTENISFPHAVNNQLYVDGGGGPAPEGYLKIDEETEEVTFTYKFYNVDWVFTGKIFHE